MDIGLFLNFSIYSMNITFEFMETLPKMNTGIFGETGASSGDAADRQGPAVRPGNQPGQEIGAALADFVVGPPRTLISPIVRRSVTWKN